MKRILIISKELVFEAGLINILTEEDDLEIIGLATGGKPALLKAIKQHRPHAVVVLDSYFDEDQTFLDRLTRSHPEMNIISVNPDHNLVTAFCKKEYVLNQASDLAKIIRFS